MSNQYQPVTPVTPGARYGRLTVICAAEPYTAPSEPNRRRRRWRCACECGKGTISLEQSLRYGWARSCGCLAREKSGRSAALVNRTHGLSKHPLYFVYRSMIHRCYNPKNKHFSHYGGRGIGVCPRWRESIEAFVADMGPKPSKEHSLERIRNDEGYSPDNCKWATRREQVINRRVSRFFTIDGETRCIADWAASVGLHRATVLSRLQRGLAIEEALTTSKFSRWDGRHAEVEKRLRDAREREAGEVR